MKAHFQPLSLLFLFLLSGCSTTSPTAAHLDEHGQKSEAISHYTCPMHPSVKEKDPGICPICKMDLTAVTV